jgi:SAM-dependent methyltransferase
MLFNKNTAKLKLSRPAYLHQRAISTLHTHSSQLRPPIIRSFSLIRSIKTSRKVGSLNPIHQIVQMATASLPPASQGPDWDSLWAERATRWDRGAPNPAFIDFLRAPSNPPTSPDANPTPGAPKPDTFEHTEEVNMPAPLKDNGTRRKVLVPGCGTGYDVALLASWGYDAYGLEISKHAVDEANAYLENSKKSVSEGEYKIKDEKLGKGSVQCLLGDYFDDAWVREAGGLEGFDIIYDHTVCPLQVEIFNGQCSVERAHANSVFSSCAPFRLSSVHAGQHEQRLYFPQLVSLYALNSPRTSLRLQAARHGRFHLPSIWSCSSDQEKN